MQELTLPIDHIGPGRWPSTTEFYVKHEAITYRFTTRSRNDGKPKYHTGQRLSFIWDDETKTLSRALTISSPA